MAYLPHLQTFLAVYRAGTVTRAAQQLNLTQPAASGHIKALESRLGRKLFDRLGRGVSPTPAGHELARSVAAHLDALESSLAAGMLGQGGLAGIVHVGGPAEFVGTKILPILGPLVDAGMELRFRLGVLDELLEPLEAGELDLAIATRRVPRRGIAYQELHREEFVLVGGAAWASRLASGRQRMLEAIIAAPILAYDTELPIIRRYFRLAFGAQAEKAAAVVVPDLRSLMLAAAAGVGISVLPRYLCERGLETGELVQLYAPEKAIVNTIYLAWNRQAVRSQRVAYVRDSILGRVAGLPRS